MSTSATTVAAHRIVPPGRGWQWIVDAWKLTAGHQALFIGLVVALLVLTSVVGMVPVVGSLVAAYATVVLTAGVMMGCDALRRGEPLKFDHLFAAFTLKQRELRALGVAFAVATLILTLIGDLISAPGDIELLLNMLMGVVLGGPAPDLSIVRDVLLRFLLASLVVLALSLPLYMALWFAIPLTALRGVKAVAAAKASFAACAENMVPLIVWSVPPLLFTIAIALPFMIAIAIRSVLLGLVAVVPLLLGGLLLAALTFASIYTSYRDVFALGD